jgi:hypothetical protein
MLRGALLSLASLAVFLILAGCGYIPVLSKTGILPGPSAGLLVTALPASELSALLGQYGEVGTQECPQGQIWIGTLNLGGSNVTIDACVPAELASQYAQSIGGL